MEPCFRVFKRALIDDGLVIAPSTNRFTLSPSKIDSDGMFRNGGNYLKALFTLAELYTLGWTDSQNVARVIGVYSSSDRYPNNWMRDFHAGIEQHIDDAMQMVNGGYRLLIHTQKPKN